MKDRLQFEPSFVEEAVFWTVRSLEAKGERSITDAYHTERNSIYPVRSSTSNGVYEGARSERAFQEFYADFFVRLGLRSLFENLLAEFPLLDDPKVVILIKCAFGKKEEGSELYRDGDFKTVLLNLQTKRILERFFLCAFIRHELLRISDMLDPRFQYSPETPLGGRSPVEENLIRDRFRFLWDLYIDLRLGQNLPDSKALEEIGSRKYWTQEELLELARNTQVSEMLAQNGFECPLCGFHSYGRISDWQIEDAIVFREIEKDRPDWKPSLGACLQCFELYHSKLKVTI